MAQQKGRDIVLSVGDGTATEGFQTVGGLRTKSMAVNNEIVDTSNATHGRFRKLLQQAGITSLSISGSGVFEDDSGIALLRQYAMADEIQTYRLAFGNGDVLEGEFQLSNFTYDGEHNGAQMWSGTLESSGQWTFTPAA